MHIMMLCNQYVKNGENIGNQFVHAQAKALQKRGNSVSILSIDTRSFRRKRRLGIYWDKVEDISVCVVSIPCGPIPYILDLCIQKGIESGFERYLKEKGMPDVIHAHFQYAAYLGNVREKFGVPIVTTEHASWILSHSRTTTLEKKAIKAYNMSCILLCVGKNLQDSIIEFYNKEIEVVPNVVSDQFKQLNLQKNEEFTFISVGHLRRHKNHQSTIEAFAKFHKKYPRSKLEIIGTGEQEQELKALIKKLGVEHAVLLLGYIQNVELVEFYNKAHCFCLPSQYETFGVVYIEAMACGLPVIGNECAAENGIIEYNNGLCVDLDAESIYSAMCSVYENYEEYKSSDISDTCRAKYGEEIVCSKLNTIYQNVTKG